jgi:hypothetical protein
MKRVRDGLGRPASGEQQTNLKSRDLVHWKMGEFTKKNM